MRPFGENSTDMTEVECPSNSASISPVPRFHNITPPPPLAEARSSPSGEIASASMRSLPAPEESPASGLRRAALASCHVSVDQYLIVPSRLPLTSRLPSGENRRARQ